MINKKPFRQIICVFLVMILTLALASCTNGGDQTKTDPPATSPTDTVTDTIADPNAPQYGGTLRLVSTAEGASPLGIPWENNTNDTLLLGPMLESLVRESVSGEIFPWLATDWELDEATKTLTMNIRDDVYFHDGSKMTAEDVEFCLTQAIEAKQVSAYDSCKQSGEYQIQLTYPGEFSNIAYTNLGGKATAIISKAAYEKNGKEWAAENPIGTGPFKLERFIRGQELVYVRNDNYWAEGKPYLDGVEYHFIKDTMTQQVAMQQEGEGSIDILTTNSGEQVVTLQQLGAEVHNVPIGPMVLVPSSTDENSPLSKLEVRQAISCAIDRDSIVAARGFGVWTPAYQYVPEGWDAHIDGIEDPYDVEKAKKLLADAGYADGFDLTFYCMPNFADKDAMVAIQSQLALVGINAILEFPDSGGYMNYRKGTWDGVLVQHMRALPNINSTYRLYLDPTPGDLPDMFRSEKLLADVTASIASTTLDAALTKAVNEDLHNEQVIIPLWNIYDSHVMKANVMDSGHGDWGSGVIWISEDAWIKK